MFYLNKCLGKINTHWPKTAWVTKIYQTFQPTAEELKPSEKWNTLLPRHQTRAILIYQEAYFTLKIIDTNSIHSALLCQSSSSRAEREADSALSANPSTKQGCDHCSHHNWTPAALTKLCQTQTCSTPKLLWALGIRKDFHILRTGKQWSSLSKARHLRADWRVSQAPRSDLTADPAWSRRLDQIISQGPFQMELCCESQLSPPLTHAGTGLTLLSWVTWHFHSWYIHFLKHLTPY